MVKRENLFQDYITMEINTRGQSFTLLTVIIKLGMINGNEAQTRQRE